MSSGFATALELSARIIRENDQVAARRLITEKVHEIRAQVGKLAASGAPNLYCERMLLGYESVLAAMYRLPR
jgi:hypothetical protein